MGLIDRLVERAEQVQDSVTRVRTKARARRLTTTAILEWCETAVSGIGRSLYDYQRGITPEQGGLDPLEEARMGAEALLTMIEELCARRDEF